MLLWLAYAVKLAPIESRTLWCRGRTSSGATVGESSVKESIFVILMDVPAELDAKFNRLYDTDHLPQMMQVPAIRRCDRYRLEWSDNPDMHRYLALYEIADPEAPRGPDWKRQAGKGSWASEMRPFITSRRNGVFEKISEHGARDAADGAGPIVYFLQQGIPAALEERFNALYDGDHIPLMMQAPGVTACTRYRLLWSESGDVPDYLAIYGIDEVSRPRSTDWKGQTNKGAWPTEMRPHFTARRNGVFSRIASFANP